MAMVEQLNEMPFGERQVIGHIRVIVIENDVLARVTLMADILRSNDITVVGEACSDEDAIRMATDLLPDVLIMGAGSMPTDSNEVARKIHDKHAKIGIMTLTLQKSKDEIFASLAAGVTGFAVKDTGPEHLHTAIRSVFAGDTWIDAQNTYALTKYHQDKPYPIAAAVDLPCSTFFTSAVEQPPLLEIPILDIQQIAQEPLSSRELQVVKLIVDGLSNREIADKLVVSLATAKSHVRSVLNKFAVTNRTQAAIFAMKEGIL
jgi:DNA-binding NarL/FixJ family response regulator